MGIRNYHMMNYSSKFLFCLEVVVLRHVVGIDILIHTLQGCSKLFQGGVAIGLPYIP